MDTYIVASAFIGLLLLVIYGIWRFWFYKKQNTIGYQEKIVGVWDVIAVGVILIFLLLLLFHCKTHYVKGEIRKHDEKIEKIICHLVKENIRNDFPAFYMPHITKDTLFWGKEEKEGEVLVHKLYGEQLEVIEKEVETYFLNYFRHTDSLCKAESVVPFIIYPESCDEQGNILMQPEDLSNIKLYIESLKGQVDKAIEDVKNELSLDMDRLNNWTSIWIGVLCILGALLPMIYSFKNQNDTRSQFEGIKKEIAEKRQEWEKQAEREIAGINERIEGAQDTVKNILQDSLVMEQRVKEVMKDSEAQDKRMQEVSEDLATKGGEIKELSTSVGKVEDALEEAKETLQKALVDAQKALEESREASKISNELKHIVQLSHSLSVLKQMDFFRVQLYGCTVEAYLEDKFKRIMEDLARAVRDIVREETDANSKDLFGELVGELVMILDQVKNYLKGREQLKKADALSKVLNGWITARPDQIEPDGEWKTLFQDLIDSLQRDQEEK